MEDTAMKKAKKKYLKPSMNVYELQHKTCLLVGSDPSNVPWWDGEGD